jgi:hypothetical protein
VDERARRIGLNEELFRQVNERLEELAESFGRDPGKLDLICECGNASCANRIEMEHGDYERLRSDPATFAIVKGHEITDVEEIVEQRKGMTWCARMSVTPRKSPRRPIRAANKLQRPPTVSIIQRRVVTRRAGRPSLRRGGGAARTSALSPARTDPLKRASHERDPALR